MKRLLLILTLLINLNANAVVIDKTPLVIGETISFKSKALNETRQFNVYLPVSYFKAQSKHYPVIYLLDGGVDEDLVHMSGLTQFLSFSWIHSMPEVIVVGIQNVDRRRDFTYPSSDLTDQKELPTSGKSSTFISHLSNELFPLIDDHYRTTNNRTLVGQSLGGLLASTILHQQPNMFTNYLIVSPSLWWDKESLLSRPLDLNTFKGKVFITVGEEGQIMKRVAKSLYEKTLQAGLKSNMVAFEFYPTLDHGDVLHLGAYKGLGFLFNKPETR